MPMTVPHKTSIDRQNFSFYIKASGKEGHSIRIWASKSVLFVFIDAATEWFVREVQRDQLGTPDF